MSIICRNCNEDHVESGGCNNNAWEAGQLMCPHCGNAPLYALEPENIDAVLEATPCAECSNVVEIPEGVGVAGPHCMLVWTEGYS